MMGARIDYRKLMIYHNIMNSDERVVKEIQLRNRKNGEKGYMV